MASPATVQKEVPHWFSLRGGISKSDQEEISTLDSPSLPSRLSQKLCSDLRIPHTLSLSLILRSCISNNYDFGTAYARLRPRWHNDMTRIEDTRCSHEARDNEIRRVVQQQTHNELFRSASTPLGPVQQPGRVVHSNLKLLRIEPLNFGAEYVWLDVLCLRQTCGPNEALRANVPTIGNVYQMFRQARAATEFRH
ncbi:hypothetical protein IW261DRAFT_1420742 [Armillaria novae-zelandiae]|uniref:Heterokaryon incompatibility domain-containing protein n=1 Tax=Armillaria novae-zelandiae TaxID=153914 RepID=A0AA39U5H6_9AGAR|nr:hypothetical protein IW261DRAFT_1420742 [Armillaria novae-zelandiae]